MATARDYDSLHFLSAISQSDHHHGGGFQKKKKASEKERANGRRRTMEKSETISSYLQRGSKQRGGAQHG